MCARSRAVPSITYMFLFDRARNFNGSTILFLLSNKQKHETWASYSPGMPEHIKQNCQTHFFLRWRCCFLEVKNLCKYAISQNVIPPLLSFFSLLGQSVVCAEPINVLRYDTGWFKHIVQVQKHPTVWVELRNKLRTSVIIVNTTCTSFGSPCGIWALLKKGRHTLACWRGIFMPRIIRFNFLLINFNAAWKLRGPGINYMKDFKALSRPLLESSTAW